PRPGVAVVFPRGNLAAARGGIGVVDDVIVSGDTDFSTDEQISYAPPAPRSLLGEIARKGFVLWLAGVVVFVGAAGSSAAPFAYIANTVSNNISVIDVATNGVVATVPVGQFAQGAAVTPDGSRVYATNTVDGTVSVINAAT